MLTIETEVNREDSKSANERGPSWFVGLVVQKIFVLPWLLGTAQNKNLNS
jgi:hypothetical protein